LIIDYTKEEEFIKNKLIKLRLTTNMKSEEIVNIAKNIELILIDVDGTLTNGELFLLPGGEEIKGYNVKDGVGIVFAQKMGIKIGIITGKDSNNVLERAKRLSIKDIHINVFNKLNLLHKITKKYDITKEQVCYIGDDINDYNIMKEVGLPVAVGDAHYKVKEIAKFVTNKKGGAGAVREAIDIILEAKGLYDKILNLFNNKTLDI